MTIVDRNTLRAEARPFAYAELHDFQKKAAEEICRSLRGALNEPRGPLDEGTEYLPALDRERRNQVIFLSGPRGSGKTSVVLSLMRAVNDVAGGGHPVNKLLSQEEAQRLIWLDMLDLDPLPASTNLLAAILVRIEAAAMRAMGVTRSGDRHGTSTRRSKETPMLELQRMETDMALAWDGNLAMRGAHVDPDVFAVEVRRAERARLGLNWQIAQVLQRVGKEVQRTAKPPLFILFVDDFDLNPVRAVELLRLIRTVAVPNLFTIISGDLEIAEEMFDFVITGELARVAPPETWRGSKATAGLVRTSTAEIAANAMRKLLPPSHRVALGLMDVKSAKEYKPHGDNSLEELMKNVLIPISTAGNPLPFSEFLLRESLIQAQGSKQTHVYIGAEIMRAPLRHVTDLWHGLKRIQGRSSLIDFFGGWLRQAVAEDPALTPSARRAMFDAVYHNETRGEWELRTDPIELNVQLGGDLVLDQLREGNNERIGYRVTARQLRRLMFRVRPNGRPMSPPTAAALALFRDLLVLTGEGIVTPPFEDAQLENRVVTEWEIGARDTIKIPWTLTVWESFWSLNRFAEIWNQAVRIARHIREQRSDSDDAGIASFLAFMWIAAGAIVLTNEDESSLATSIRKIPAEDWTAEDINAWERQRSSQWANLESMVKNLKEELYQLSATNSSNRRFDELQAWFISLGYMLSPEVGFDNSFLNPPRSQEDEEFPLPARVPLNATLQDVWKRRHIKRKIEKARAKRMGRHFLTPQGLAMAAPKTAEKVAERLVKDDIWSTGMGTSDQRNSLATLLKSESTRFHDRLLNSLDVVPDIHLILDVLAQLQLRETELPLEDRLILHALRHVMPDDTNKTSSPAYS